MRRKNVRTRGKFALSKYFQDLKEGDRVAVTKERALPSNFPERLQGRSGKVAGKRGRTYIITLNDHAKEKTFLIEAIHLKKLA